VLKYCRRGFLPAGRRGSIKVSTLSLSVKPGYLHIDSLHMEVLSVITADGISTDLLREEFFVGMTESHLYSVFGWKYNCLFLQMTLAKESSSNKESRRESNIISWLLGTAYVVSTLNKGALGVFLVYIFTSWFAIGIERLLINLEWMRERWTRLWGKILIILLTVELYFVLGCRYLLIKSWGIE
jgi:hypothetical protein